MTASARTIKQVVESLQCYVDNETLQCIAARLRERTTGNASYNQTVLALWDAAMQLECHGNRERAVCSGCHAAFTIRKEIEPAIFRFCPCCGERKLYPVSEESYRELVSRSIAERLGP